MVDLNALRLFAKIMEAGSFSETARRTAVPVSTISRRIAELETQLGVRLLERSTRRLRLTEIGTAVLEQARRGAELSDTIESLVAQKRQDVSGTLRLSAPPSISDTLLAPLIGGFQTDHPAVRVELFVTSRPIDHIADGIDLAVRVGPIGNPALVTRRILRYRHQLVASPAYLAAHEPPQVPQDLLAHRLLAFSFRQPQKLWELVRVNGIDRQVLSFVPHLEMNDYAGLAPALLAGTGIGELPPIVLPSLLREGKLVEVMPDWRFPTIDLSLAFLANRHLPQAVRVFKDYAARKAPTLFPALPV